jgi:NADH:ubiquinone oxidoreductase subunit K
LTKYQIDQIIKINLRAYLFCIGIFKLIMSQNMVRALMCLELLFNVVNINFVTFFNYFDTELLKGKIFSIFVIAIAAAEAAIGLAIVLVIHRNRGSASYFCENLHKNHHFFYGFFVFHSN